MGAQSRSLFYARFLRMGLCPTLHWNLTSITDASWLITGAEAKNRSQERRSVTDANYGGEIRVTGMQWYAN